jgi:hypothetical protein
MGQDAAGDAINYARMPTHGPGGKPCLAGTGKIFVEPQFFP